ncbi:hypothetical protein [Dysgonomonas sp. 37-18]|uniref:hypothetical protein n=1 Tax=Dysgonomonas sp. 37-18 TaxID=1895907 RepID=UPI000927AEFA|nr:hypothetical protein [Dysgonomonas sp. 37-18]OJX60477.1 MAG: hypothetical protein BGO84_08865 [Dysgonomonas sp. 37-18]
MNKSSFALASYKFDHLLLDMDQQESKDIDIAFEPYGLFKEDENSIFNLTFIFKAFNKNVESPFIKLRCIAEFKFEGRLTFEEIPNYFYVNSIAILFPYVRAFVSTITLQANIIPPILLPTWNLESLAEPLKMNTKFDK